MKKAPILLASRPNVRGIGYTEEDDWELQYELCRPDQIVVAGDGNGYQVFGDQLYTAPQGDILESELPLQVHNKAPPYFFFVRFLFKTGLQAPLLTYQGGMQSFRRNHELRDRRGRTVTHLGKAATFHARSPSHANWI